RNDPGIWNLRDAMHDRPSLAALVSVWSDRMDLAPGDLRRTDTATKTLLAEGFAGKRLNRLTGAVAALCTMSCVGVHPCQRRSDSSILPFAACKPLACATRQRPDYGAV